MVAVWSPDRLARKYAYQVLLLEEFRRVGCEVVFLQHPLSDDPNDQLLLQIQGAMAEYERALLQERFRRGRLQKIRAGHYLSSKPPYGYRYIRRDQGGGVARFEVVEDEARVVRLIFAWVGLDRLSVREVCRRLHRMGCRTPSGNNARDHAPGRSPSRSPGASGRAASRCPCPTSPAARLCGGRSAPASPTSPCPGSGSGPRARRSCSGLRDRSRPAGP